VSSALVSAYLAAAAAITHSGCTACLRSKQRSENEAVPGCSEKEIQDYFSIIRSRQIIHHVEDGMETPSCHVDPTVSALVGSRERGDR